MKNVRHLKKIGLYTDDTVCIGRRYTTGYPSGTPASFYVTYFQPRLNNVIMVHADGSYEAFIFNSESLTSYFRFKKINDLIFHMRCYCYNDYIVMFRKKMKFHGIDKFRISFIKATDDDFGNYVFKFKNSEDSAIFQMYFSDFID